MIAEGFVTHAEDRGDFVEGDVPLVLADPFHKAYFLSARSSLTAREADMKSPVRIRQSDQSVSVTGVELAAW